MECRIIKNIAVLGKNQFGIKELNIVRWFDKDEKFDIRIWTIDHERFKGGLTLSYQELVTLKDALNDWFCSKEGIEVAKNQKHQTKDVYGMEEIMYNVYKELKKRGR